MPERRTPEQVRAEIDVERKELAAAVSTLASDAKRAGRLGSIGLAAAMGALALRRLGRGRRKSRRAG